MCLTVIEEANICVKKCTKYLLYSQYVEGAFETPYRHIQVPNNGWLMPHSKSSRKTFRTNNRIHGGFIHAYSNKRNLSSYHDAYAIQVTAFGGYKKHELICRAMYIPDADTSENKEATIKFLNRRPNIEAIVKRFPFLKKYVTL